MNDRVKRLQTQAAALVANPLIPRDIRAAIADAAYLLAEMDLRLTELERKESDHGRADR